MTCRELESSYLQKNYLSATEDRAVSKALKLRESKIDAHEKN